MAMYMTKVWGFSSPSGPLQFGINARCETARQILQPGDVVILVGTKAVPTSPEHRGRILGMMEPTTEVVSSLDFDLQTRREDFDEAGRYLWPYALLIRKAWEFERPYSLLEELSSRKFNMDAASGIVPLTNDEASRIAVLPRREIPILTPVRALGRIEGQEKARRRGAPPPTTTRRGVMHMRRAPAYTYAMAIRGARSESFKIGWAFDYRSRQRGFNLASMPQLGGLRYETRFEHLWDTAQQAFNMEQRLLRQFASTQHPSNREIIQITEKALEAAWIEYLAKMRRPNVQSLLRA
jgi:hypothetical protein